MSNDADPLVVDSSLALSTICPHSCGSQIRQRASSANGTYLKELRCELCNFLYLHEMILQSRSLALQDEACVSDFSLCGATSQAWSLKFLSEEKAVWNSGILYFEYFQLVWQVMWSKVMVVSVNFHILCRTNSFRSYLGLLHASLHYLLAPCCDLAHLFGLRLCRHFQAFSVNLDLECERIVWDVISEESWNSIYSRASLMSNLFDLWLVGHTFGPTCNPAFNDYTVSTFGRDGRAFLRFLFLYF